MFATVLLAALVFVDPSSVVGKVYVGTCKHMRGSSPAGEGRCKIRVAPPPQRGACSTNQLIAIDFPALQIDIDGDRFTVANCPRFAGSVEYKGAGTVDSESLTGSFTMTYGPNDVMVEERGKSETFTFSAKAK